jgi:hypothetical protein
MKLQQSCWFVAVHIPRLSWLVPRLRVIPNLGPGRRLRLEDARDELQVVHERGHLGVAGVLVALAEDGAGVNRRRDVLREV